MLNSHHVANGPLSAGAVGNNGNNNNVSEQPAVHRDCHTSDSNNEANNQKLSNAAPNEPSTYAITAVKSTATSRKRKRKDKEEVSLIKTGGGAGSGDGFSTVQQPPSKSKRTAASASIAAANNRQKEITDFFKSPRVGVGVGTSLAKDGFAQRPFGNSAGGGIEILNVPSTSAMPSSAIMLSTSQYAGTVTTSATTSGATSAALSSSSTSQRAADGRLPSSSSNTSLPNVIPISFQTSGSLIVSNSSMMSDERDAAFEKIRTELESMTSQLERYKKKSEDKDQRHRRCIEMERRLLIELATNERKAARTKLTHNRMRIGQYVTTREGDAAYVSERFSDGFAFMELKKYLHTLHCYPTFFYT